MLTGHFDQFSIDRLMRFLVALEQDINIEIKPAPARRLSGARIAVRT